MTDVLRSQSGLSQTPLKRGSRARVVVTMSTKMQSAPQCTHLTNVGAVARTTVIFLIFGLIAAYIDTLLG